MVNQNSPETPAPASNSLAAMRRLAALFALFGLVCLFPSFTHPQTHPDARQAFLAKLSSAAIERTQLTVRYDPAYRSIPYPNGDVPADTGVCTDEVIRSYRTLGIDLQKEVHEDMEKSISAYPNHLRWMQWRPDKNIDHRRVPNLQVFFSRKGESLPVSSRAED